VEKLQTLKISELWFSRLLLPAIDT